MTKDKRNYHRKKILYTSNLLIISYDLRVKVIFMSYVKFLNLLFKYKNRSF